MEKKLGSKIYFGTLALGENYRNLAKLLSKDIEKYSPKTPLIVLMEKILFFKDKLEINKLKKNESASKEISELLTTQKQFEYPSKTFIEKVISKITKQVTYLYCLLSCIIVTMRNLKFYYL
ncbi:hypothetical protein [Crocosphaera sp.]|uniref:hypothetical protein n=1 Tax=Crocosphaera sp. TaxID=2729996 RepID=UPI0026226E40|nr:hypothetical protein [Crocosphaera sp.]MDJ0579740.1 hypothetical protein [Crocosphaera sp.]